MWCRPVRMVYKTVALSLCGLSLAYAEPVSLSSAWQAARVHDPSFLAAVSERGKRSVLLGVRVYCRRLAVPSGVRA